MGRVYFHLVENKQGDFPFAFLATYAAKDQDKVSHMPLKNALTEFTDSYEMLSLLSAVGRVANESAFISQLVESGELFSPLRFNEEETYQFLKETPLYEKQGVICRIPDFWKKKRKTAIKVTIGDTKPSSIGMDANCFSTNDYSHSDQARTTIEILSSRFATLSASRI